MEHLLTSEAISALLTLTFLEIVLGIDNLIFISIITQKLSEHHQKLATNIGLFLAMLLRIVLLFGISVVVQMQSSWLTINTSWWTSNDYFYREVGNSFGGINRSNSQANIISEFLPEQLTEAEIEKTVIEIITQIKAEGIKDMGKVMGIVSNKLSGKADGKTISNIVKQKLLS